MIKKFLVILAALSCVFIFMPSAQADPVHGTMSQPEWDRIDVQPWPSLKGSTQRNVENDCNCGGSVNDTWTAGGYSWKQIEYPPPMNVNQMDVVYMKVDDTWHAKSKLECVFICA